MFADRPSAPNGSAPASSGSPVEVARARKVFGTKVALQDVNLTIPPGVFCVLLGPSGSGKTTLLRSIAGIERLTSGQISIGGRLVADGGAHIPPDKRDLSMVFQDYALWPHLTAARNVAFALGRKRLAKQDTAALAQSMLERVGLAGLSDRYPNELSGGEQQRVALARALVASTGVLLFDEPLSNLDADLRERMRLEIGTLTRDSGATSIYITHDQSEAFALADMIGVLHDGRLVQVGTPEEIYHRPATPFVARFTGLAGEIPVLVTANARVDNGSPAACAVRPRGTAQLGLADITATAPSGAAADREAVLLIRPSGVQLLPPGHPERHLEAVVMDTAYRGRGYDHAITVGDGSQLVGIHDQKRWTRGDRVAVRLLEAGCLLFPSSQAELLPLATTAVPELSR